MDSLIKSLRRFELINYLILFKMRKKKAKKSSPNATQRDADDNS